MDNVTPEGMDKKRSWKGIALVVVAGLAVLLLCTTIVLAATGTFKSNNRLSGASVGSGACSGQCPTGADSCQGKSAANCSGGADCRGSGNCSGSDQCPSQGSCSGSQSNASPGGVCPMQGPSGQASGSCH